LTTPTHLPSLIGAKIGARTHSIVTNVLRTCQKQCRDLIAFIAEMLRHLDSVAPSLFADAPPVAASP
jgi:hypothetical protein